MTAAEPFSIRLAESDDDPVYSGPGRRRVPGPIRTRLWRCQGSLKQDNGEVGGVGACFRRRPVVGRRGGRQRSWRASACAWKSLTRRFLGRGLWRNLRRNLGLMRAFWATMLLSYPRYTPKTSEVYVERLVVTPGHRNRGMARELLHRAESPGPGGGKRDRRAARQRQ